MNITFAQLEDVELLVTLRQAQLIDEGLIPDTDITPQLTEFFTNQLNSGLFVQCLIRTDNGEVAATGAIIYYDFPPSYYNHSGIRGYIANMYTVPKFRGQRLATTVLDELMKDAKSRQVHKIFLYGSEMGKPVYEKYGFKFVDAYMEYSL